jgi:hypothetical protein
LPALLVLGLYRGSALYDRASCLSRYNRYYGNFANHREVIQLDKQLHVGKVAPNFNANRGGRNYIHTDKPHWGLWTSTLTPDGKSSFVHWVESESQNAEWGRHWTDPKSTRYIITPKTTARIYTIDSWKSAEEFVDLLENTYGNSWTRFSKDYDAVHDTNGWMPGWDSESTVWFRNVFESVEVAR